MREFADLLPLALGSFQQIDVVVPDLLPAQPRWCIREVGSTGDEEGIPMYSGERPGKANVIRQIGQE